MSTTSKPSAREILRREYGDSRNFITPDRLRLVHVQHPETGELGAAEISEGSGFPSREERAAGLRRMVYGVSVVWLDADGATRRTDTDEPYGSRVFHDPATDKPWPHRGSGYTEALAYVRQLGGKV